MNHRGKIVTLWLALGTGSAMNLAGCGASSQVADGKPINVVPLTDEQKAAIKANDQSVEDTERGANYKVGKKKG